MEDNNLLGKIVLSLSGRDKGKLFVVMGIINQDYVFIANGKLRRVENPKKKKLKHLRITTLQIEGIYDKIKANEKITNTYLRNELERLEKN